MVAVPELYMGPNVLTQSDPTQYPTDTQPDPRIFGKDTIRPKPKAVLQSPLISLNVDCTFRSTRICSTKVNRIKLMLSFLQSLVGLHPISHPHRTSSTASILFADCRCLILISMTVILWTIFLENVAT